MRDQLLNRGVDLGDFDSAFGAHGRFVERVPTDSDQSARIGVKQTAFETEAPSR